MTFKYNSVYINGTSTITGPYEAKGPFNKYYDKSYNNFYCGTKTWEQAESKMLVESVDTVLSKVMKIKSEVDLHISGDLLNQITSSSFAARELNIPFIGLYGACSTMSESLSVASLFLDGGFGNYVIASTSSHFSSAERQFRFPLEYGCQRCPTCQWTVTGSGAVVLGKNGDFPEVTYVTTGLVKDYGVKDANNMGAAMAPAAVDTIYNHFKDTGRTPKDYDVIATGDLGKVGKEITTKLLLDYGYDVKDNYVDCGDLIFDDEKQKTDSGGSGCGCSAVVTCGYFYKKLMKKEIKSLLLVSTGALMSTTSSLQGESIPGIAHAVAIEYK